MHRTLASVALVLCLTASAFADVTDGPFPLADGNEWIYRADDGSGDVTVRIDQKVAYRGDDYYRMRGYNGDVHWVKQPVLGTVTNNVSNRWYRFNNQVGSPWTFQVNSDSVSGSNGTTLHISTRRQRVMTPAGLFECLRVSWDTAGDGITDEWFAEGIGLVQRRERRNGRKVDLELVRATVSGQVVAGAAPATPAPTPTSSAAGPFGISGTIPSSRVTLRVLLDQALVRPTDVAFHPQNGSLWITDRSRDSVVVIYDAGLPTMHGNLYLDDSDHFNNNPMAMAFSSARQEFATALDNRNDYNGKAAPNNFMGPTLWPTTSAFTGASASHLDMLHHSPNAVGIAAGAPWQGGGADPREYWVFNGDAGSIDRYFFREPHVPGGHDHSDGLTFRYGSGLSRVPGVAGHLALDAQSGILYIADTGNGRIATLDTRALSFSSAGRITGHHGETPLYSMAGARIETLVSGLQQPSGLILHQGQLVVSDHATGTVHAFTTGGAALGSVDTGLGAGALMGLTATPAGTLALVDCNDARVVELTIRN